MKVVYNASFGGYGLSREAKLRLVELGHVVPHPENDIHWTMGISSANGVVANNVAENDDSFMKIARHDSRLVQVVEELGPRASDASARLLVDEIQGTRYRIDEYDGRESVETPSSYEFVDGGAQ